MEAKPAAETTESKEHTKCTTLLKLALGRNKKVMRLIDSIEQLGCPLPTDFLSCHQCPPDQSISGGFAVYSQNQEQQGPGAYKPQVLLCENKILESSSFENTLVHELTHAYDQCRLKLDWKNCLHHACAEIRASSLSGECDFLHEVFRGKVSMAGGHEKCVKRRANLSVNMNPNCQKVAADAVEAGFGPCYGDKAPFGPHEET
jgi:inner membrane protease ATP23